MKKTRVLIVFVCVMAAVNFASADTIRGINIDFVTIGNAGNPADNPSGNSHGAVGYNYRIGKYEVTNAQWDTFTAAASAPTGSDGGYSYPAYWTGAQQPTNNVSWYETLQFCNYLTSGDKSKGAYQFSGNNSDPGSFLGINRTAAQAIYGTIYVIPTEDEWYKAAYYKPDNSGYSDFANGTDTQPIAGVASNYNKVNSQPWDVGVGNGTMEQNGTFDMTGNVYEWNENLVNSSDPYRRMRGGSFSSTYPYLDIASSGGSHGDYPYKESNLLGFRVASIPEPATILLLSFGGLALIKKR
ncbi:MAG: SUMF1/EgtB/PvdO family nonheme iron enzyme [Sedimentisphaerales bacterium]